MMYGNGGLTNKRQHIALLIAAVLFLSVLLIPLVSAGDESLTRGSRFTITVTGMPNTPYYVWLTRTYTMSGEPGDQPPVLVASQANIVKDPPGGPYVIGSYLFNNGGGRTIREDVAPSTVSMSDTQYYALVTTDNNGRAIVAFQTSANTAIRAFSVKVENPQSVAKDNILVQRGDAAVTRGSVVIETIPTLRARTTEPAPTVLQITETFTVNPTTTESMPLPPVATPAHQVPIGIGGCFLAVGTGILFRNKPE